jgi:hemerythrin-like domain-containing protein
MPVTLGAKPDHSFDEPVGLLADCHRRIEHFLGVLLRVTESANGGPLTLEQRDALGAALRYFKSAAPRHTEDEEQSLFPRMRQSGDERVGPALAKLAALEADHRTADAAHREVDDLGTRWLSDGSLPRDASVRLVELLRTLDALYRRHIEVEDHEVFPLAKDVLSVEATTEVGREMARRRGLEMNRNHDSPSSGG